jgi:hypothetical protein
MNTNPIMTGNNTSLAAYSQLPLDLEAPLTFEMQFIKVIELSVYLVRIAAI